LEVPADANSSVQTAVVDRFAGFSKLPERDRDMIVWELNAHGIEHRPEQKTIARDLLAEQGYRSANNNIAWTSAAIDDAEKQGWKDLTPLVTGIYERPRNIWNYERAFRYLRSTSGHPLATSFNKAVMVLHEAGYYRSAVTDSALERATTELLKSEDKEAVLVYGLYESIQWPSKGGSDRGRKAAVEVLQGLNRATVTQKLRQFHQAFDDENEKRELNWLANQLGIPLE